VEAHGRLAAGTEAPDEGELLAVLAEGDGFVVEQILSGRLPAARSYEQDHDEWFVVLAGGATLVVDGAPRELGVGDWWLLPAGTPHTLARTEPGTSWLVVRSAR
jgi:cupin 2 domain-containing protein